MIVEYNLLKHKIEIEKKGTKLVILGLLSLIKYLLCKKKEERQKSFFFPIIKSTAQNLKSIIFLVKEIIYAVHGFPLPARIQYTYHYHFYFVFQKERKEKNGISRGTPSLAHSSLLHNIFQPLYLYTAWI